MKAKAQWILFYTVAYAFLSPPTILMLLLYLGDFGPGPGPSLIFFWVALPFTLPAVGAFLLLNPPVEGPVLLALFCFNALCYGTLAYFLVAWIRSRAKTRVA